MGSLLYTAHMEALLHPDVLYQWEWGELQGQQLLQGLSSWIEQGGLQGGNNRRRRDISEMPVVFIPEETETECVPDHRMSSFGFLGLVVASINAVVNVANNINNNNNNNNDNNNNQVNTNIANSGNEQSSMSMAMS